MNMLMSVITTDTAINGLNGDVGKRRLAPVRPGDSQVSVTGGVSYQATVIRGGYQWNSSQ